MRWSLLRWRLSLVAWWTLLGLCLGLSLCVAIVYGANTHQECAGSQACEENARQKDLLGGYVVSGCVHPQSGTTTVTLPACKAYTADGTYIEETVARTWTYTGGNGTYWFAAHKQPGATLAGWNTVSGTHYRWMKSDTRPTIADTAILLGRAVVGAGGVTPVITEAARRLTTSPETLTTSLTTSAQAPWVWSGPGAVITIAAGQSLRLGTCPQAGPFKIFHVAVGTGIVEFEQGACDRIYPEWWGADNTGVIDATAIWSTVIAAAKQRGAIHCSGVYRLSSSAGVHALVMQDGTQILGTFRAGTTSPGEVLPCRFRSYGPGVGIGTVPKAPVAAYTNLRLENIHLSDESGTGATGLQFNFAQGIYLNNVQVEGFNTGAEFVQELAYGWINQLDLQSFRLVGLDLYGAANGVAIEMQARSTLTTVTHGLRLGTGSALTSHNPKLWGTIEIAAGRPVLLQRAEGIDAELYVTHPGLAANYVSGAVLLAHLTGGRVQVYLTGTDSVGTALPLGLWIDASPSPITQPPTRNLLLTGRIKGFTTPLQIDAGEGQWGMDISGLDLDHTAVQLGDWTTGTMVGRNYHTVGLVPGLNQGRGSALAGAPSAWQVGDTITYRTGVNTTNVVYQVTGAGNPPQVTSLLLPHHSAVLLDGAEARPAVRVGNTWVRQLRATAAGVPITNFLEGLQHQTIEILATQPRTIVHHAQCIVLQGKANFDMTPGDVLTLRKEGGAWVEVSRSDKQ